MHIYAQNSTFGEHLVENRRFETCRQAGLLTTEAAGFAKTAVLELPPGWNPYLGSLFSREDRKRAALRIKAQNSTSGEHLVENRRFESCRQAGILLGSD